MGGKTSKKQRSPTRQTRGIYINNGPSTKLVQTVPAHYARTKNCRNANFKYNKRPRSVALSKKQRRTAAKQLRRYK